MLTLDEIPIKRRVNAEKWLRIIDDYNESNMPIKKFCQINGINSSTFYYWFNYLNGKISMPNSLVHKNKIQNTEKENLKQFVSVKIAKNNNTISSANQKTICDLQFNNGMILKIYDVSILPLLIKKFS